MDATEQVSEPSPDASSPDSSLNAWLLTLSDGIEIVLAQGEVKYLEQVTQVVTVPGLPAYSSQAFVWREQLIPLLQLSHLLSPRPTAGAKTSLVAIVAYRSGASETLHLGALPLAGKPELIQVTAEQARPLDCLSERWPHLSCAALSYRERIYPVLDLSRLFGSTPHALITLH